MAYDIGPKIGIEGEAEFRKAIGDINTNLKTLGTEMAVVTSAYDKNDKSAGALNSQNEVLNKQIDEQKKKLEQLKLGLEQSATKYGENDKTTQGWQQSVNKATADLNNMERQLKQNNNVADESNSKFSGLGKTLSSFGGIAGKAVAAMGAAAIGAGAAIGAMTVKAAYAADDINTLSKQTGLSTEEIQKFQFASEQIDVPMETLTGSMAKLTKNMSTAKTGTGAAADAFSALGISITDSNGELRSNQDVFDEAIGALGEMENGTQRDAYAMQMFGKSAQELNPLILGGADALKELGDQAEAAGIILSQDALDNLNLLSDAIDTFKATAGGTGNLFATAFAGPLAEGINTVTGYINDLSAAFSQGGFSAMASELGTIVSEVIAKLNEMLPKMVEMGLGIIKNLVGGISQNLPVLVQGATEIILMLVDSLIEMLPEILQMGITMLVELANGISKALPQLIPSIVLVITQIVTTIIQNLPQIISAALKIIIALTSGLIQAIPDLIKAVPQLIGALVSAFKENMSNIIEIGKNIVRGVWDGIKDMASWFTRQVKNFFADIVDGVKKTLGINSPSKVFAGIGGYMAEGLGQGFTEEMKNVARQINNSIPTSVSLGTQTSGAGGTALAGSGDTKIYVYNPQPSPSGLARQIARTQVDLANGYY